MKKHLECYVNLLTKKMVNLIKGKKKVCQIM